MPDFPVDYTINGVACHFTAKGDLATQDDRILIDADDNLLKGRAAEPQGFEAIRPWEPGVAGRIKTGVAKAITDAIEETSGRRPDFALEQYHKAVSNDEHYKVVRHLRNLLTLADQYLPIKAMDEGMSKVLGFPVSCWMPAANRFDCSLRIIRPKQPDNNPLHRDVWLDRLRHAVNIYGPVAGSNDLTSLSMIPGSHHWKESDIERTTDEGCTIDGIKFTVSAVLKSKYGLSMIRPPLGQGEILMFSPYMIHGGARNLSEDTTRTSLEMRFKRKA